MTLLSYLILFFLQECLHILSASSYSVATCNATCSWTLVFLLQVQCLDPTRCFKNACLQAIEEVGTFSAALYNHFALPVDAEFKDLIAQVSAVTKACLPILKHGPKAELTKAVEVPLVQMREAR